MARDILIVDDEADIRMLIGGLLSDAGYEVREAGDADTALAAIGERQPSLAILDVWLEGSRLDGLELLQAVQKAAGCVDTGVVGIIDLYAPLAALHEQDPDRFAGLFDDDNRLLADERWSAMHDVPRKRQAAAIASAWFASCTCTASSNTMPPSSSAPPRNISVWVGACWRTPNASRAPRALLK